MRRLLFGVMLLAATACGDTRTSAQSATTSAAPTPDQVVAEVGGRKITLKELDDKWQAVDPGEQARVTQLLYQNRRNVLDQWVGDLLIEAAAKAAGLSTAQYLEQEQKTREKPVTDADVQQFYEANKERAQGRTLEQLGPQIRTYLASQRVQQSRAQLVDDLKTKSAAGLRVMLDPPRMAIELADHDPVRGSALAPVTIVEFSDYQCPFCARVNPTLSKVRAAYGDKVRIVFKDFPLPNHSAAPKAAEAGHCAGEQGKFWEMHDRIFGNQQQMDVPALKQHAATLSLDLPKFNECLDSGKFAAAVNTDLEYGSKLGVGSTPTLYINGRALLGAQPFEAFKQVIDEELARK